jgi:hypothetical protein
MLHARTQQIEELQADRDMISSLIASPQVRSRRPGFGGNRGVKKEK